MEQGVYKYAVVILAGIAGIAAYNGISWSKLSPNDWAAWVQAVGSVAAILSAIWIAGQQHRRDVTRREEENARAEYVLRSELAWLSGDVLEFLNQFIDVTTDEMFAYVISDDDVSNLLDRLAWCRLRAQRKGQLLMIGQMQQALMVTVRIIRMRTIPSPTMLLPEEVKRIQMFRTMAMDIFHSATGFLEHKQYME